MLYAAVMCVCVCVCVLGIGTPEIHKFILVREFARACKRPLPLQETFARRPNAREHDVASMHRVA